MSGGTTAGVADPERGELSVLAKAAARRRSSGLSGSTSASISGADSTDAVPQLAAIPLSVITLHGSCSPPGSRFWIPPLLLLLLAALQPFPRLPLLQLLPMASSGGPLPSRLFFRRSSLATKHERNARYSFDPRRVSPPLLSTPPSPTVAATVAAEMYDAASGF